MLYLDHNATTPLAPHLYEVISPYLAGEFGNPSSGYSLGKRSRAAVENARRNVARLLGAAEAETIFTSGGTESIFAAIVGSYLAAPEKKHLIISSVEHPAVKEAANFLSKSAQVKISTIPVNERGQIELGLIEKSITAETLLVSVMLANNETGIINPIEEIVRIGHAAGVIVHTDAVQAVGKIAINFSELGVDLLSLSGHKFGAPKGIGALLVRTSARWEPVVRGGGQEHGRRGGTESVPLLVGLGVAAAYRIQYLAGSDSRKLAAVRDRFENQLKLKLPDISINGEGLLRLPNTCSVAIPGIISSELIAEFDKRGIFVSGGSACKATTIEPSQVLLAMGRSVNQCLSTVRISFGPEHEIVDAERVAQEFLEVTTQLRENSQKKIGAMLT